VEEVQAQDPEVDVPGTVWHCHYHENHFASSPHQVRFLRDFVWLAIHLNNKWWEVVHEVLIVAHFATKQVVVNDFALTLPVLRKDILQTLIVLRRHKNERGARVYNDLVG